jgi:D-3-phosphoglycerate dehydrogenase
MKILVAEPLAPAGLELLRAQKGWEIVVSNPKEYSAHLADCDALLVRSAVKVSKDVLAKAPELRVIGRAGVGVDNVDLKAATAAGVLVMNTPGGNAVSVAEHTFGFMLAMARAISQANASTKGGKWEKKKFLGNELRGKVLGIMGLGSIGREVVKRAKPFEMTLLAYDPYVSTQAGADMGVELVDLPTLYAQSDYISLHVALTPETDKIINADALAQMKQGVRIINVARGELIDSAALNDAIKSGKVAGAALDVFDKEPPPEGYPLFQHDCVLATPHIGGSTEEAQEIVGIRIVEQVVDYLVTGVAVNAVNMPTLTADQHKALGPYVELASRLGNFVAHVSTGNPCGIRFTYFGKIADSNTNLIRNAGVAGVLNRSLTHPANLVNAMPLAGERGWNIEERHEKRLSHMDSIRIELETAAGLTTVEGAVVLDRPRLVLVDNIYCEAPLNGHLLFLKNDDVPGTIGYVGGVLGRNGINIANFSLGRQDPPAANESMPLEAISVIETDDVVPDPILVELLKNHAIKMARPVEFIA